MRLRTKLALNLLVVLAAWVGWQIHRWGRPVPPAFERVAMGRYRLSAGAGTIYVAEDADGDGTVDGVYPQGTPERGFRRPLASNHGARWLIVCLDGVPYSEMKALWEEGFFREFFAPSHLISTFPSHSETALTEILHTAPVPGYEHRYFSRTENHLRGGIDATLFGARIPYLARFDYDTKGVFKGLPFVVSRKSYRADLGRLRRRFLHSQAEVYVAHIGSTDSIYHVLTRGEMRTLLVEADALLRDLYYAGAGKLRITVFSDHGSSLVPSRSVPLRALLAERGWQLTDSLHGPRDVVVPAYGLVGFLAVYCQRERVAELAHTLAEMEGVDLVVSAIPSGVAIESGRGRAVLEWTSDGKRLRYRAEIGDPLELAPELAELKRSRKLGPDGYISDADLFAATARHRYPDAAYRLRQWATNHVLNRADILVSLAPGYHYGRRSFEWIVTLQSTHGSLDREQSAGFAMTTDGPLPAVLRSRDLLAGKLAPR